MSKPIIFNFQFQERDKVLCKGKYKIQEKSEIESHHTIDNMDSSSTDDIKWVMIFLLKNFMSYLFKVYFILDI